MWLDRLARARAPTQSRLAPFPCSGSVCESLLISIQTHKLASLSSPLLGSGSPPFLRISGYHLLEAPSGRVTLCCAKNIDLAAASLRSHRLPHLSARAPRHLIDRCDLRDKPPLATRPQLNHNSWLKPVNHAPTTYKHQRDHEHARLFACPVGRHYRSRPDPVSVCRRARATAAAAVATVTD